MKYPIHQLAAFFPPLSEAEFAQFKEHIRINGLQDAIILYEEQILDGTHRERACNELGIEPRYERPQIKDPIAYVIGQNLHRRHLTPSQFSNLVRKLVPQVETELKERAGALSNDKPPKNPKGGGVSGGPGFKLEAVKQVAMMTGRGEATIYRALKSDDEKPRTTPPKRHYRADEVIALHDNGMTQSEVGEATGIHPRMVRKIVEHENLRRSGEPQITPDMLSMSQREKLERAITQEKKRLGKEFYIILEQRIKENLSSIRERLDKQRKESEDIIKSRRGFIKKRTWNLIRTCLHPDIFDQIVSLVNDGKDEELSQLKARYSDAFRMFKQFEKLVLDEKESPTSFAPPLPKTPAEWAAARVAATEARKAKRQKSDLARR